MTSKKQKTPLVIDPPITSVKLKKIGERHGDQIGDEFKPQKQIVVRKKPIEAPKSKDQWSAEHKQKQRDLEFRKKILTIKATKYELFFERKLKLFRIKHQFQKGLIDGRHFMIADFFIPELNILVELDGGYHLTERQKIRDYMKDKHYKERKFKILRLKNEEVYDFDFVELKKSIDQKLPTDYLRLIIY
jgi:very-short-patch-repair endonuclease